MKFDKSIYRDETIKHTSRSSMIDCGVIHTSYTGGGITLNTCKAPPILHPQLCIPGYPPDETKPIPSYKPTHHDKPHTIESSYVCSPSFTGYAPGILLSQTDFSYDKWGDLGYWVNMVENRQLIAKTNMFVQVNMLNNDYSDKYGVNLYYVTRPYVQETSRWEPLLTEDKSAFSTLIPAEDSRNLKSTNPFHIYVPAPGDYVLIARYCTANVEPLPKIIDPDEYNKKDDWSFLAIKC